MWAYLFPVGFVFLMVYFVVWPIVDYFRDPKGFRKHPGINWLAGISDLGFMWEAQRGSRSKKLAELHQTHPIIRIGPNSLSYGRVEAVKVLNLLQLDEIAG
jgi:hypothetical protein